ncbi:MULTISPECIES: hypothetical protein [unclassified Paenibacillus]|uniref:hypothetical protein n=1 Tax=unclassified Paenibacillus TaxID=185978 RepID=UPI000CFA6F49|nr:MULTISPECIES: hypothetical protein [unclassified Paenibacillus]MBJ9991947.1 hypothetical protein [Paenibacillus sp. S28]PQP86614.1 hypothetical protein CPT76_30410 [Paenibacillus sp. AR247]
MIIAFIVLAVLALVFLFIYNARMSKKAAKKQAKEPFQETAEPTAHLEPVKAAEPPPATTGPVVSEPVRRPEPVPVTTRRPQAAEQQGDRAYRDALRQFAGGTPAKEEEPPAPKPDYSTDNAYREALRSMAKNKK